METLNWSGAIRIGVESLDAQHRAMKQAIDELQRALEVEGQQSLVGPLLRKVSELTRSHFSDEESMMLSTKYPGMALHLMKHQHLLEQLDSLAARFNRGGFQLTEHSIKFLHDWFETHIQKEDLQFALWVNEHGKR
jgi:hemerythrin